MNRFRVSLNGILALSLMTIISAAAGSANAQQPKSPAAKAAAAASQPAKSTEADNSANASTATTILGNGTTGTVPVFYSPRIIHNSVITQTGNGINVAGAVGAVAFSGDGSALTNVPAVQFGGLPPSAFAQTGASNTFSADQTINGNLNVSGYVNGTLNLQGNLTDPDGQQSANVTAGFAGNAAFGGNSIAAGVIGATISGGGGAYDPSQLPARPKSKHAASAPINTSLIPGFHVILSGSAWSTIGGGLSNTANGIASTISGGYKNITNGSYSTVSGGELNNASGTIGGSGGATVSGGENNFAFDDFATIGGGQNNTSKGKGSFVGGGEQNGTSPDSEHCCATVAGGFLNQAFGGTSTIAGGGNNVAQGLSSTVGGGTHNQAFGLASTVPGGISNNAVADQTFAAGCYSTANYIGSFVWSSTDGSGTGTCVTTADGGHDEFVARAVGGFILLTSTGSTGAILPAGSGSWSSISDRNAKANFTAVDEPSLLEKLAAIPIATWNYKTQADSIRHLGPMAQDFRAAFGLGEDDKHISTVDAEGVALAGIQALYAEMKQSLAEKDREIADLQARLARLEQSATK